MNQTVWVILRCEGRSSEPWKVYANEEAASEWVKAVAVQYPSVNITYEIYALAVLINAMA